MKRLLLLLPFFLLGTACSSDEDNNIESQAQFTLPESTPKEIIPKSEMPYWLSAKLQDIEDNLKPLDKYKVYQGVWKEETYITSGAYCRRASIMTPTTSRERVSIGRRTTSRTFMLTAMTGS